MSIEEQYIDLFRSERSVIDDRSSAVMNSRRDDAARQFIARGFPPPGTERYKYTDISALFAPDYGLNLNRLPIPIKSDRLFRCDVPSMGADTFFVINDTVEKSRRGVGGKDCYVGSINGYSDVPFLENYYGRIASDDYDAATALNTMFSQDALLVRVTSGARLENAVQVINITRSDVDLMVNRRVLIVVEDGASATILFCDHSADDHPFLVTEVTEVHLGRGARLDLYCLEETNDKNTRVSNVYFDLSSGARLTHNVLTLTSGTTRNAAELVFRGEGAECFLLGCAIEDHRQHVDNNTLIRHEAARCESRALYKYVLDEESVGAFAGKVLVSHGAEKTVSDEVNRNLLAATTARMYSQPMLEIYADDVKCSHGSAVGQLDDDALFYMRQRGIPLAEARKMLETAFIDEVIDAIALIPLRCRLRRLVKKRFRGELSTCRSCRLN